MVDIQQPTLSGPVTGDDSEESPDTIIATTGGMVDVTLDALAGDDTITGNNVNEDGVGILSSAIDGGAGNDSITGAATGAGSFGIFDTSIDGAEGNDIIIARGTNAGIQGVTMEGGDGDDIFDIQGGTGTISAEAGTDRLILAGSSADYNLTPLEDAGVIQVEGITPASIGTSITTGEFEEFQFDDGVISDDEIFANGSGDDIM